MLLCITAKLFAELTELAHVISSAKSSPHKSGYTEDITAMTGFDQPFLPVILTSGHPRERVGELPPGVAYMPKPWQPLKVLIAAE
jgi:hypothetical protein